MATFALVQEVEALASQPVLYRALRALQNWINISLRRVQVGQADLAAGVATVQCKSVTATSLIFPVYVVEAGTVGRLSAPPSRYVLGVSFQIVSTSNTDTSAVNWLLVND